MEANLDLSATQSIGKPGPFILIKRPLLSASRGKRAGCQERSCP
jgi:hypothetical protein